MNEIHIYDLDGTVIDSSHRYRTITKPDGSLAIDLPYWRNNSHRAIDDTLLPMAKQFIEHCYDNSKIVMIATARVMGYWDWISIHNLLPIRKVRAFIHRPEGSKEKGASMKIRGITRAIHNLELSHISQRFFYEDNLDYLEKVCYAINAKGIYVSSNQGY